MMNNRPLRIITGSIFFLLAIVADQVWDMAPLRIILYLIPYLVSGHFVLYTALQNIAKGKVFDEFSLMSLATIGAFVIGEYPEGVFVMLFYELGEYAQHRAVNKAREQIDSLVDQRPETAHVKKDDGWEDVPADDIDIGNIILIKKGEQVPIDGELLEDHAVFNTASITGEAVPRNFKKRDQVISGYINEGSPVRIQTNTWFEESTFSRIIRLTKKASENKAPTEAFFRRFAKVYTPAVAILAIGIFLIPLVILQDYQWQTWLYRACVFLVISCPCALVLSIPLTYFAGIGSAGKAGILPKGANFLDQLSNISGIVFDKTGTLTKGELKVRKMKVLAQNEEVLKAALSLSNHSSHPVSVAVSEYLREKDIQSNVEIDEVEEVSGKGIGAKLNGKILQLGSPLWIALEHDQAEGEESEFSKVFLSFDGRLCYIFHLDDELKPDAKEVINFLKKSSIRSYLLSGDRKNVVEKYGTELPFYKYMGEMSPEEKLNIYREWEKEETGVLAFAGDGINDSIVMASSELGIAMGNKGSDIAIQTADIIIPGDKLSHIPQAIQIGQKTQSILWQNIVAVLFIKLLVLVLGGVGFVSLWMAILADVGIALVAVLNASRLIFFTPEWKFDTL